MIDTHCHLELCDGTPAELVAEARDAGVERLLAIGMTDESCRGALEFAAAHDEVYAALGRHPHESEGWSEADLASLRELAANDSVRAIGETGLDYKRDYAPRDDQRRAFADQIALANELNKPLVIHTRFAAHDSLKMLEAATVPVIIHCFSLTEHVGICIQRGYYCSFAGNVTYPNAAELQEAAREIPDDRILVETDAPYLTPQRWRGERNVPARVTATADFLAQLRETTIDEFAATVGANAERLFSW